VVVFGSLAARTEVSRASLHKLIDVAELPIFDVNLRPPYDDRQVVEDLLGRSRWVKLNEDELALVGKWVDVQGEVPDVLPAIASHYGLDAICVTFGGDGAAAWFEGQVHRQAAFDVDVVDTIGCGDAFLATWIAAMLQGVAAPKALARACAVGAIVAAQAGANQPITAAMIDDLIGH
jgi:fructokinase